MTPKEQEVAIGELEERVDRLRTLYEQYFLGFEKLEPMVPRKDVERRFALLRKEQIRNTAMRFRFNVVTQKFNTYSMHWVRICRQIEEGTYKRHVRRAKARFGDAKPAERDISVDIDLGDFEDLDLDEVLAEADAAADKYARGGVSDTVPPQTSEKAPEKPRPVIVRTPAMPFAPPRPIGARIPTDADSQAELAAAAALLTAPTPASGPERVARPVAVPQGAKPRIVRKVTKGPDEVAPGSQPMGSQPMLATGPASDPQPGSARAAGPAAPPPRPPAASSPRLPAPSSPSFGSAPRVPASAPSPSAPSVPRAPAAPHAPAAAAPPSSPAVPAGASPSAPRVPVRPRIAPIGQGSAGKVPAAPPASPSAGRVPVQAPAPTKGSPDSHQQPPPAPPSGPQDPGRPRPPLPSHLFRKKE